jgi:hypothetical protein
MGWGPGHVRRVESCGKTSIIMHYLFFIWVVGGHFGSGEDDQFLNLVLELEKFKNHHCLSGPVFVLGFVKISI